MRSCLPSIVGFVALTLVACGDIEVSSVCKLGETRVCLCPSGASGNQICTQSGDQLAFGACVCTDVPDATPDAGADVAEPDVAAPDVVEPDEGLADADAGPTQDVELDTAADAGDDADVAPNPCGDVGSACDDGDLCTTGDACRADGTCVGEPVVCDDGVACSADLCSPASGACLVDLTPCDCPPGDPCDDDDPCTVDDACKGDGETCGGAPKDCDDDNGCTVDGCVAATGACLHDGSACACFKAADCEDDNPCTADACVEGACVNTPNTAASCSDGDPCTTGDACLSDGSCVGAPKVCDDGVTCSLDICDPVSGQCGFDTSSCACVVDGDCNDSNPCTADACDAGVCLHAPVSGSCEDGDACTLGDACDSGKCVGGAAKDCADALTCSADLCDPETGTCTNDTAPCECTSDAACPPDEACTDHFCDLPSGVCAFEHLDGAVCDDGSPCTTGDLCDDAGACAGEPVVCDDAKVCSVGDACDETTGECQFDTSACACEADADCGPNTQCVTRTCEVSTGTCKTTVHTGQACDDANGCTLNDACSDLGACVGQAKACSDGISCTVDGCLAPSGVCAANDAACECEVNADCNDANPCTTDTCDAQRTCKNVPAVGSACNDNSLCTTGDVCTASGTCKGSPKSCDDGNPCTKDSCAAATGTCTHTLDGTCPKRHIFVTTKAFAPDFSGFAKADELCGYEDHVSSGGQRPTNGTYKALIGTQTPHSATSRIATTTSNCVPQCTGRSNWILAPNTLYVQSDEDFIFQTDANGIFFYTGCAAGKCQAAEGWDDSGVPVWTGLSSEWTPSDDCYDWTSLSPTVTGVIGKSDTVDKSALYVDKMNCGNKAHLICVEQ